MGLEGMVERGNEAEKRSKILSFASSWIGSAVRTVQYILYHGIVILRGVTRCSGVLRLFSGAFTRDTGRAVREVKGKPRRRQRAPVSCSTRMTPVAHSL